MKIILAILLAANIFIAGCKPQKSAATQEEEAIASQINKAADDLSKQLDVFSADVQGTSKALKKKAPEISSKIQELFAGIQNAIQELLRSLNINKEPPAQKQINI